MPNLIQQIETILLNDYPRGYAFAFLGQNAHPRTRAELSLEAFQAAMPRPLPPLFLDFYAWMLHSDFVKGDVAAEIDCTDYEHTHLSLSHILKDTTIWQNIQQKQPDREWKQGFVALNSWGSAYQLVIDTQGEINNQQGCLAFWDFKGGSNYIIQYANFEQFLLTKLELLKAHCYFQPAVERPEFDDFHEGVLRDQYEQITVQVNGPPRFISFA